MREKRSEEFQAAATFGEVPLLTDAGVAYVQSNAILLHLARQESGWGAETLNRQKLCEQWLLWEANKIGMCLPQIRSFERFEKDNKILEDAMPWLKARYAHDVGLLNSVFRSSQPWILEGDAPTIADFSLCAYLQFADEAKLPVPQHVSAWLTRLANLPGWQHPYQLLA